MENKDRIVNNVYYKGITPKLSDIPNIAEKSMIDTIDQDITHLMAVLNKDAMMETYVELNICKRSIETGLYQLIYNGKELWYGTLQEINAIVKSMIVFTEQADYYTY